MKNENLIYAMYIGISSLAIILLFEGIKLNNQIIMLKSIGILIIIIWARTTGLYKFTSFNSGKK